MFETKIKKPVIIIGCPRSGTTLLYTILSESPELYSLYHESWDIWRALYKKGYLNKYAESDVINEDELSEESKEFILKGFEEQTINDESLKPYFSRTNFYRGFPIINPLLPVFKLINGFIKRSKHPEGFRIVEKTPRNCFRVAWMNRIFPDAKFVYISRDGRSNISSLIEGWKRHAPKMIFQRVPVVDSFQLSNFDYVKWEYTLPPGWQDFKGKTLEEVCAFQWAESNRHALDQLEQIDSERVMKIKYEDLTGNSSETIQNICKFAEIPFEGKIKEIAEKPPVVSTPQHDKPKVDKWLKNKEAIEKVLPKYEQMLERLGYDQTTMQQA